MLKKVMQKTAGIFTATAVIVAGLVAMPTVANANETPQQLDPPKNVILTVDSTTATEATIKATLDKPLENAQSTLSLYKTGNPITLQTANSGTVVSFTVPRPTSSYDQYYATVGALTSNTTTVTSPSSSWTANLGTTNNVISFKTNETPPQLKWNLTKPTSGTAGIYVVDKENGNILTRFQSTSSTTTYNTPRFYTEISKEYIIYIADYSTSVTNITQLANIKTISNSVKIYRASWTVSATTDYATFSTENPTPKVIWTVNQPISATGSKYSIYVVNNDTGAILQQFTTNSTLTGSHTISRFYNGAPKNYKVYVAARKSGATNISELTDIQSYSNIVAISRAAWNLSMSSSSTYYIPGENLPVITWTTNQETNPTSNKDYKVYVADNETGKIIYNSAKEENFPNTEGYLNAPQLESGKTEKTLVGYVAAHSTTVTNVSQLQDIQAISNPLVLKELGWELQLHSNTPVFASQDEAPVLTWETTQSLYGSGYNVFIANSDTGKILTSSSPLDETTSTFQITKFSNQTSRNYIAYVADENSNVENVSQLQNIKATSNIVTIQHLPWIIEASIDRTIFTTDEDTPNVTWVANQSIPATAGNSGENQYAVYFADVDSKEIFDVSDGYEIDEVSPQTKTQPIDRFYEGGTRNYAAYIAKYNGIANTPTSIDELEDIQAISNTVSTTRYTWTISLGIDKTIFSTNDATPRLTWITNQNIHKTRGTYEVYIINPENGEIVYGSDRVLSGEGVSFSPEIQRFYKGDMHSYVAYVAKQNLNATNFSQLQDIQAVSQPVSTQRAQWGVELKYQIAKVNNVANEKTVKFMWNVNQTIQNTNDEYEVYVVNKKTGKIVYSTNYDTESALSGNVENVVPLNTQDTYLAYVAKRDSGSTLESQLKDIQATSNSVFPQETSETVIAETQKGGGNPSEADCNQQCYGDPVNSFNGEFFENYTDLSISSAIPFDFTRSYSTSSLTEKGAFGAGWTHNYNMKLTGNGTSLANSTLYELQQENGAISNFAKVVVGSTTRYVGSNNIQASFAYNATTNEYEFLRHQGTTYIFNTDGVLTKIQDRNNNYLTLIYTNSKLTAVKNNVDKTLTINWNGNRISSITDGTRIVTYQYDSSLNVNIVDLPETLGHKQYIYDTDNRITSIIHPNGGAYRNYYNNDGQVEKQSNPLNQETLFSYSKTDNSKTTTITLPSGIIKKEIYNRIGQLVEQQMAVGTTDEVNFLYEYDFTGQISKQTDPDGNIIQYTHDNKGSTTSVTDALNRTIRFTYNDLNQIVEMTNQLGQKTVNTYDAAGNLLETKTPSGAVTKYEVNPNGTNSTLTAPKDVANQTNKKISFGYDSNGHVNSVTQPEGGSLTMLNDNLGNPLTVTNPLDQKVFYTYDAFKRVTEVKQNNNSTNKTEYDNAGRVIKETDSLGRETTINYDLLDRVTSVTTILGTVAYTYNIAGQLEKQTDIDSKETIYEYDKLGRVKSITDPKGNKTINNYYVTSLLKSTTDALGKVTSYEYDEVGNLTKTIDALGNETIANYDSLNRVVSTTASNNYSESYEYNTDGQLVKQTKAGIHHTKYEYDASGNLIKTIYPDTSTEERTYDSNNSLITVKDRDGKITTNQYNVASQLIKTVRPDTTEASYSYTNMGQLDSISYDNWATIDLKYIYDIAGRVTSEFKNRIETTYSYDSIGNLTRRGPPSNNGGVNYNYNQYGELTKLTYPSGIELTYSYDGNGNLSTVKNGSQTLAEYIYDANNNNTRTNYGNGTYEENKYDALNRLTQFAVKKSTTELYKKQMQLNNVGFIIGAKTSVNNSTTENKTYSYNSVQQLQNITNTLNNTTQSYNFDSSHNLLDSPLGTNTFSANGQINTNTKGNVNSTYVHDLRGNRTSANYTNTNDNTTKQINYTWSPNNKLTNYVLVDTKTENTKATTNTKNITYKYDASGLVVNKLAQQTSYVKEGANETSSQNSTTNNFVWDTLSSIPTLIEDNQNNYVYGLGSTPFAQIKKNAGGVLAGVEYSHTDERGSVVATTLSSGELSWTKTYDEYGAVTNKTANGLKPQVETPFAYAGEYLDADTGLYNLRARWYEPGTASFISKDPAILSTGEGYSYGSANPLTYTDALGLSSNDIWNGVAGFIDGVSPIPVASAISNWISPGSVNLCSPAYVVSNVVGTVTSFFIPGGGALKIIGMTANGIVKITKNLAFVSFVKKLPTVISNSPKMVVFNANKLGKTIINSIPNMVNKAYDNITASQKYYKNFDKPDYVYRGVMPSHPGYEAAKKGIVAPPGTRLNPSAHNSGVNKGTTAFSSWSRDPKTAATKFATDKGILLRMDLNAIPGYRIFKSPDTFNEQEILITGRIENATVLSGEELRKNLIGYHLE